MKNKDAYLIIAHKQQNLLKELIRSLDYEWNDIYVHIDKKSFVDFSEFDNCTSKSNVYFFQHYNVKWGTCSQVDTEMFLFKKAYYFNGGYRYYHLLSGQDLPIKPIDKIYHYFDNKDIEFLEFGTDDNEMYRFRIASFNYEGSNKILASLFNCVNKINNLLGKDRLSKYNFKVYKGSNWASLSNNAVKYLVGHTNFIYKITRYSHCADEIYKQTILMNADEKFIINQSDDIRYIDWKHNEGTSPRTLRIEDYENSMMSDCLFARKFDMDIDEEIIKKVNAINR